MCGYDEIARALTDQLKKDGFGWFLAAEQAFVHLKTAMNFVPVLALPDFNKPFILESDTSGHGLALF